MSKNFTPEEVESILRRALEKQPPGTATISVDILRETARELGINPDALEYALQTHQQDTTSASSDQPDQKALQQEWLHRQRQKLRKDLLQYAIVNTALFLTDFLVSGLSWFFYPLIFWGMGLAIHAVKIYHPSDEDLEKGAEKLLQKKNKKQKKKKSLTFSVDVKSDKKNVSDSTKSTQPADRKTFVFDPSTGQIQIIRGKQSFTMKKE